MLGKPLNFRHSLWRPPGNISPLTFPSPRDHLALLDEGAAQRMGRVEGQPDEGVRTFVSAERGFRVAHFRTAPAGAHGIDHELRQEKEQRRGINKQVYAKV